MDAQNTSKELPPTTPPPPTRPERVPPPPPVDDRESPLKWLLLLLILVGLFVMPFFLNRRQPDRKSSDSRVLGKGIADAITQYYGDYNRLPRPASATAGKDADTDTSTAEGMIRILTGKEPGESVTVQNSRKTNYLEGMKAAKARTGVRQAEAKGSDKWVSGLVMDEGTLEAVDGWGGYYRIRMDSNYDGEMVNPNTKEVGEGRQKLPNRVIIWGAGKDGKWETWDDNVKSWD
ncbi:MAG: hypothetical protein JWM59_2962 [Verrucomicrobiales bacterium]|nr:hypothetical protein [Verrucomicrobiales bacterium]